MPLGSPTMAELPYSDDDLSLLRPRAKVLLRKRMRQLRGTLPAEARARRSAAVARGLDVALPVVGEGRVLSFRWLVRAGQRFPTALSAFGIDEPTDAAPEVDLATLDVVIVPALAMDPRGHRLGFGRALYDNTLALMTQAARVATVFAFQMIAEVPNEAHDQRVHFIVTDEDTYRVDDAP